MRHIFFEWLSDVAYALRVFKKNAGFAAAALVTLAIGIGANTAIFSVFNAVLLNPLPYAEPSRLVTLWGSEDSVSRLSVAEYFEIMERQQSFQGLALAQTLEGGVNITGDSEADYAYTHGVSPDFFSILGVAPMLGRAFEAEEGQPGQDKVVILEHKFWVRQFGADRSIVGHYLTLNGERYQILGVMPSGFFVPNITTDMWVPTVLNAADPGSRTLRNYILYARIKPEVGIDQASQDIERIFAQLAAEFPQDYPDSEAASRPFAVRPAAEMSSGSFRLALLVLFGAVLLVLLIACANFASLLLSRSAYRERDMAVRAALGAGRWRIVRQLLTESALLAMLGGSLGILVAFWTLKGLVEFSPLPRTDEIQMDFQVLAFALAVSLLTGVVSGLGPALKFSSVRLVESLKEGGRQLARGSSARLRQILVAGEVALSLILLIGAGLLGKTFYNLLQTETGYSTESIETFRIDPPSSRYPELEDVGRFYQQLLEKIRARPGVIDAGGILFLPLHARVIQETMPEGFSEGRTQANLPYSLLRTQIATVTPGYFEAMGIALLSGRTFNDRDNGQAAPVAIVDKSFAEKVWPDESDIVGKRLAFPSQGGKYNWRTIVGLVAHARDIRSWEGDPVQAYFPQTQLAGRAMHIAVRTDGDPSAIVPALRSAAFEVDPLLSIYQVRPMDYYYSRAISQPRFYSLLMGLFALLAFVLGIVGLYGVVSYAVSQRAYEFGIRMALGAKRRNVLGLVIREGLALVAIGAVLGLAAAFAFSRLMQSLLFGVEAIDLPTYAALTLLLAAVALLACIVPARRATQLDPYTTLRNE